MSGIYLDNAATTRLDRRVLEEMLPWLEDRYGNASAVYYGLGREANLAVEAARARVAALLGASPEEIHFTSGATEANNWALTAALTSTIKRHAVTCAVEHHAVLEPLKHLTKRGGVDLKVLPVDESGRVAPEDFAAALRSGTAIASIMLANNEVGTVMDIPAIAAAARERNVRLHTDATQAIGKMPVRVDELGVDLLSLSAHKFNGPKGVGALYARKGTRLEPFMFGGGQERNRRAGTLNVPGIVGMGAAAELAAARAADAAESARQAELVESLWTRLAAAIPKIRRNGDPDPRRRLPGILSVCVEGAEGEAILGYLDMEGIQVSSGSACTSGGLEPSHVLLAMGVPVEIAHGSIRVSMGHETTAADIDRVAEVFPGVVARIRSMSVTWKE